jgi:hypothetical protein
VLFRSKYKKRYAYRFFYIFYNKKRYAYRFFIFYILKTGTRTGFLIFFILKTGTRTGFFIFFILKTGTRMHQYALVCTIMPCLSDIEANWYAPVCPEVLKYLFQATMKQTGMH